jgi:hypothetical protein
MPRVTPNLWFDTESEQAAEFYVSVFPNSGIKMISYYGEAGPARAAREQGGIRAIRPSDRPSWRWWPSSGDPRFSAAGLIPGVAATLLDP